MLRTRLLTAAILGPIVVVAALLGEPWLALLLRVIAFLALIEVIALLDTGGFEPPQVLGLVAGLFVTAAGIVAANSALVGGLLSGLLRQTDPPGLVTIAVAGAMILVAAVAFTRADARAGFLSWAMTLAITFLELLVIVLQAYVFVVLTASYISGAVAEEH